MRALCAALLLASLALADPDALERNLFQADALEADLDQADFLRRRFHVASLVVREAVSGAPREQRGERLTSSDFGGRMRGSGPRWDAAAKLFELACRRHGLTPSYMPDVPRRPVADRLPERPAQRTLFE